jgi:iron complex transport system substrate-binding protein
VRILSLLPSATEIVFALGLEGSLVGVTAECDYPADARRKPAVSFPTVGTSAAAPVGSSAGSPSAAQVDAAVVSSVASGEPLYRLDEDLIRRLRPDLILAQDLCRVCAVPSGDVNDALDRLGCEAQVLSLDPSTLADVVGAVSAVAVAADVPERGRALTDGLEARLDTVGRVTTAAGRRGVLELEWSDPPYLGGHWVPEMVEAAGGTVLLSTSGVPSGRVSWEEIGGAGADVVIFAPCGYGLEAAVAEGAGLIGRPEIADAAEVWALDGSAYFSRPGPRVVDGVELLAWVLHPDLVPTPPSGRARRLR